MLSRVPSPSARVRFAASRPCPGRRGRAVAGRRGRGGGVLLPPLVGVRWSPRFSGLACGGVSWLLCLAWSVLFRWFPWRCVRPAVGSRPGAVPPWVCRSAVRVARCPGSSRSRGFPRSPPLRASRCRGGGGFPPAPVFARCARSPVGLRCRCRFARACRRAGRGCAPWWPPVPLRLPPLPALVARVPGCRSRWLSRGGACCLAVRCSSSALAALVCRRARAFGLPPVRAGRSGRLVLLPAARPRGPSALAARLAGPLVLAAPPSLPGVPLPVPPRGGSPRSPSRSSPAFSFRQGRLF